MTQSDNNKEEDIDNSLEFDEIDEESDEKQINEKFDTLHMKYTTVWNFKTTTQESIQYKGRCLPEIPKYCIERFSKENDLVLDVFMGSGTTVTTAMRLKRNVISIDPSLGGIRTSYKRLKKYKEDLLSFTDLSESGKSEVMLIRGDSRNIPLPDDSIDFAFAHMPYWSVISYSPPEESNEFDLSRVWSLKNFNKEMEKVFKEVLRVLKPNGYIAVLTGDVRQGGWKVPLGLINANLLEKVGFEFFDFIIKVTDNAISMRRPKIIKRALEENKTVTIHEYVIVGKKVTGKRRNFGLELPWEVDSEN